MFARMGNDEIHQILKSPFDAANFKGEQIKN